MLWFRFRGKWYACWISYATYARGTIEKASPRLQQNAHYIVIMCSLYIYRMLNKCLKNKWKFCVDIKNKSLYRGILFVTRWINIFLFIKWNFYLYYINAFFSVHSTFLIIYISLELTSILSHWNCHIPSSVICAGAQIYSSNIINVLLKSLTNPAI